jgi:hypothetical protein
MVLHLFAKGVDRLFTNCRVVVFSETELSVFPTRIFRDPLCKISLDRPSGL